jgi:hypothetical protein
VSDGGNPNLIGQFSKEEDVWKSAQHKFAVSGVAIHRALLRIPLDAQQSLFNFSQKVDAEALPPFLIERNGTVELSPGFGMQNDVFHEYFLRNAAITSSAGSSTA